MTDQVATKSKRGGFRAKRVKAANAQQALLREIINACGGPRRMAKRVYGETGNRMFHEQNIVNWRNRSGVSLIACHMLATVLKIPTAALNYEKVRASDPKAGSWIAAVRGCAGLIGKDRVEYVLKRNFR